MIIKIVTAFPEFFSGVFCSLLGKAIENKLLEIKIIDLKQYASGKHKKIDDKPFGGGGGMILKPDVLYNAIINNIDDKIENNDRKILLTSARGNLFKQSIAKNFTEKYKEIIIICTRYEGVDQRVIDFLNIEEIRIGDYILMGGEIASVAIIETMARFFSGILGNKSSIEESQTSIENNFLQFDHYTMPREWMNLQIPEVIISGNHQKLKEWRTKNSKTKIIKNN